jgi:hypothetical protein
MSNKPLKKGDEKSPWAKRQQTRKRERRNLALRNLFRIYCEGANTEPEYFKAFPVNPVTTNIFSEGYGRSKTALVNHVVELLHEEGFLPNQKNYDSGRQNWVVFDYDWKGETNECHDYKEAIALAEKNKIHVAVSNDAFEIWFLLHFCYVDTTMHRSNIYKKLTELLGFDYEKEGKSVVKVIELYEALLPMQENAIGFAETLMGKKEDLDLCHQNPSTTVYKLVKELRKNMRK